MDEAGYKGISRSTYDPSRCESRDGMSDHLSVAPLHPLLASQLSTLALACCMPRNLVSSPLSLTSRLSPASHLAATIHTYSRAVCYGGRRHREQHRGCSCSAGAGLYFNAIGFRRVRESNHHHESRQCVERNGKRLHRLQHDPQSASTEQKTGPHVRQAVAEPLRCGSRFLDVVIFGLLVGPAFDFVHLRSVCYCKPIFDPSPSRNSSLVYSIAPISPSRLVPADPPFGYEEATGIPGDWGYMFPQARGNTETCTAQGFFLYIGVCASVLLTGSIAVSFLLQIKFQFSERQMRVPERYFFGVGISTPLLASVMILIDGGFNPIAQGFCYVFISPMICLKMFKAPAIGTPSEDIIQNYCDYDAEIRGEHSELYSVVFFFGPVFIILLVIIACMGMIFWTVRTQELRAARWSFTSSTGRYQKRVFVQGMMYLSAHLAVWIPYTVGLSLYDSNPVAVHYVGSFILPLQGVLNVLIYSNK